MLQKVSEAVVWKPTRSLIHLDSQCLQLCNRELLHHASITDISLRTGHFMHALSGANMPTVLH